MSADTPVSKEKQFYRVDWRNKRTGFEHFDKVEATDAEAAIRETRRNIRRAQKGVAEVDVQVTFVAPFHGDSL
jgi:hypothetical protein